MRAIACRGGETGSGHPALGGRRVLAITRESRCILFDWGDTVMRVFPDFSGPMRGWPRVEVIPGIRESLAQLHPEWTIALATNAADSEEQDIWAALERVELGRLIDRIYCYRVIGHRKSAPEYFERVLSDLAMDRNDLVMVGDDFEADVVAANRIGIRAIWFNETGTGTTTSAMHRTIHRLGELPGALDLLLD